MNLLETKALKNYFIEKPDSTENYFTETSYSTENYFTENPYSTENITSLKIHIALKTLLHRKNI